MSKLQRTNLARMEPHVDQERLQCLRRRYLSSRPVRYLIRPLLMATMLTALLVGLLSVIVEVTRDGRWYLLTFPLFFIALEGIYTTNWLGHPRQLPLDRTSYRAAELILLIIIVRGVSWFIFGEGIPDDDLLRQYLRAPQDLFLNGPFLIAATLGIIIWRLSVSVSKTFVDLQVSEFELRFQSLPLAQRKARIEDQPISPGRAELVDAFVRFWLLGGLLLVVAVGLSTLEEQTMETILAPLASGRANLEPRLLGTLLLYFIIGLWLLSQARLMQFHARWLVNNIDTDEDSRGRWQRASLTILLLVIIVAAFLPIGSTSGLSQLINIALYWLMVIANAIIFLILLPFAMLMALLSGRGIEEAINAPPVEPLQPPPAVDQGASFFGETVSMIISSGFWAFVIVVVAMALLFYLRERRETGSGNVGEAKVWLDQFLAWLAGIWARLRGQALSLQESLILLIADDSEVEQPAKKRSRWRFLRVSGLSPRDQVRYFYLSTVRRAGDRGVKRPSAGTPSEYARDLKESWPEAEESVDDLTQAFLKARYSDRPIDEDDLPPVKDSWKSVRRQLRQDPEAKKQNGDDAGEEA
jgi:hypothetical protein